MTTTKSPVSTCGVKMAFSLPRSNLAAFTATWPSTWFLASITHHLRWTSWALAEKVFIRAERARKLRDVLWSVKYSGELTRSFHFVWRGRVFTSFRQRVIRLRQGGKVFRPAPHWRDKPCPPKCSADEFLAAGSKWLLVICIVGV